jgi:hypothetical protein
VSARKKVLEQFGPEFNGEKTVDNFAIALPPATWPEGSSVLDGVKWPSSIPLERQDYGWLILKN